MITYNVYCLFWEAEAQVVNINYFYLFLYMIEIFIVRIGPQLVFISCNFLIFCRIILSGNGLPMHGAVFQIMTPSC